jgi:hypothetical protein
VERTGAVSASGVITGTTYTVMHTGRLPVVEREARLGTLAIETAVNWTELTGADIGTSLSLPTRGGSIARRH